MRNLRRAGALQVLVWIILLLPGFVRADFDIAAELYRQKNYVSAFDAFQDLAKKGDPRAKTVLALMHKFGEGTQQDLSKSFNWYHSAAEQGYPPAQFHTGSMYAKGMGVEEDRDLAVHWLTLAANQGFDRAIDELRQLDVDVSDEIRSNELIPWSNSWNFRLPNNIRLSDQRPQPAPSSRRITAPEKPTVAASNIPSPSPKVETRRSPPKNENNGRFRIQVGAMKSRASANRLWGLLQTEHEDLFADLQPQIIMFENAKKRVFRLRTGSFADYEQAAEFCERLLKHPSQAGCIPISN